MADKQLGSASVGMEIDLKSLQGQLNTAVKMISQATKTANNQGTNGASGGGMFAQIFSGLKEASFGTALLGNFGGTLGKLGTTAGGVSRVFQGLSTAGGGVGLAIGGIIAAVGAAIVVFEGLKLAVNLAFDALRAAGNAQASETAFNNLAKNLGLSEGKINTFRSELEKMSFTTSQQTEIMSSLTQALGANGLSTAALEATKAMRDLSVVKGVSTQEGIDTMANAINTLDATVLKQYGITETANQLEERYGQTIGKTAAQLSVSEKKHAILNGVIAAGAANMGLADKASEDFNRVLTRLGSNTEALKAGIGQMFLPLASGIISIVNTEVLGLAKSVGTNEDRFKTMGKAIATFVLPMIRGFISWLKAIPWSEVANNIYVTANIFNAIGKVVYLVAQSIVGSWRIVGMALATVGVVVERTVGFFVALKDTVVNFWNALFNNDQTAIGKIGDVWTQYGTDTANTVMATFDSWATVLTDVGGGMADTIGGIIGDIGNAMTGFNLGEFWNGLGGGLTDEEKEMLDNWLDTTDGMSTEGLKAAKKMAEDLAKENTDFARAQAKSLQDYQTSLAELVANHRDQMATIRKDIASEQKSYDKSYADRTQSYQDELNKLSKADDDRKKDINTQLAEEIAKGRFADQTKIASLRARLVYEDSANKASVTSAQASYDEDITNIQTSHNERLAELQTSLDTEMAIQKKYQEDFNTYRDFQIADDITKLKASYAEKQAEDLRAHQEKIADIIKQGTETAKASGDAGTNDGAAYGSGYTDAVTKSIKDGTPGIVNAAKDVATKLYDALTGKEIGTQRANAPMYWNEGAQAWLAHFANGGIVGGVGGTDNNLAAVTKGEMILNSSQQSRMFSLLNGSLDNSRSGSSGSGVVIQNMTVSLPGVSNASEFSRELKLKLTTMRTV